MKQAVLILAALGTLVVATSVWGEGRNEDSVSGPHYGVAPVMRILSGEERYEQGYLQREIDRNGDGIVDGTSESVGQYVSRIRTEARLRYEQHEGDQLRTMTQSRDRTQTQSSEQTQVRAQKRSATQAGGSSSGSSKRPSSAPSRTKSGSKKAR